MQGERPLRYPLMRGDTGSRRPAPGKAFRLAARPDDTGQSRVRTREDLDGRVGTFRR